MVQTNSVPLFSLLSQKMSWLSARQNILSQNVANADTPDYQARDLKPLDFENLMRSDNISGAAGLRATNARHFSIGPDQEGSFDQESAREVEGTPTGNAVSLEEEMIKLSDTQVQYQAATNIYSKTMGMFRTALGKGGS